MTPDLALQIFLAGFNEGFNRAVSAAPQLASLLAARRDAPPAHSAEPPAPPVAAEAPPASPLKGRSPSGLANGQHTPRRRRKLLPSEQRVLDFITSHPGCTGNEIRAACKSIAPVYKLVRKRKVRRVEAPKPHEFGTPWVRFYPTSEPTNG